MSIGQIDVHLLVEAGQLALGIVVLALLAMWLTLSGRLRRAMDVPPMPGNSLRGSDLVVVLLVFLISMQAAGYGLKLLGRDIRAKPQAASSQEAIDSRPSPASQAVPAGTSQAGDSGSSALPEAPPVTRAQSVASSASQTVESEPAEPEQDSEESFAEQPDESAQTQSASDQQSPPEEDPARFLVQGIAEVIAIALMLFIARTTFAGGLGSFGLGNKPLRWDITWAIIGYLAFWPACYAVAEASTWLYERLISSRPNEHPVLALMQSQELSAWWLIVIWTLTGAVAPLFEELLFRGLLLTWLRKATQSTWLAIALTGAVFGLIHAPQWHLVPALALLGVVLAYLYARTGSLRLVILFHAIFNLRTMLMMTLPGGQP